MSELMTESSAMSINMDIMGVKNILMEMDGSWAGILLTFLNSFIRILWFCGVQIIVFLAGLQKSIETCMKQQPSMEQLHGKHFGKLHCRI